MDEIFSARLERPALRRLLAAVGIVLTCLLLTVAGCGPDNSKNSGYIRIGAVLPLTGDSADWGQQGRWGVELAVRDINATGGIDGHHVDVIFEDSQATPRIAVAAFDKLSQLNEVPAVVGDIVSATTLAMAPLAENRHVVLIAVSASAPAITQAGRFIFRVWPSDLLEGTAAADWARTQGVGPVAILHIANDYGSGLANAFQSEYEGHGGRIVSNQSYAQDQTDFRPYLIRLKAEAPNIVYLISYYKDAALVLKQAKEIGLNTKFLGATAVESPDLLTLAGSAAEGLIYPTIVDFDPSKPDARQKKFIAEFTALNGKKPDWVSSHAYDATLVILDAMKSGARTGDEIRAAIDKQRVFEGVTGTIRFDDNGDVIDKRVVMKTVRGGAFVPL